MKPDNKSLTCWKRIRIRIAALTDSMNRTKRKIRTELFCVSFCELNQTLSIKLGFFIKVLAYLFYETIIVTLTLAKLRSFFISVSGFPFGVIYIFISLY